MNKYIVTALCVFFILLNTSILHSNKKRQLVLKCYGHALTARIDSNNKESKLNILSSIFLYSNGEGILTQTGKLIVDSKKYFIDRTHKVHFLDDDNDGVYTMKTHSMMKRANDTLPDNLIMPYILLKNNSADLYVNIERVDNDLYLFNESNRPLFFCKKS